MGSFTSNHLIPSHQSLSVSCWSSVVSWSVVSYWLSVGHQLSVVSCQSVISCQSSVSHQLSVVSWSSIIVSCVQLSVICWSQSSVIHCHDVNKEVMNCESNQAQRGMSEFESEREGATMQMQTELSKDTKVTTN